MYTVSLKLQRWRESTVYTVSTQTSEMEGIHSVHCIYTNFRDGGNPQCTLYPHKTWGWRESIVYIVSTQTWGWRESSVHCIYTNLLHGAVSECSSSMVFGNKETQHDFNSVKIDNSAVPLTQRHKPVICDSFSCHGSMQTGHSSQSRV